MQSQGCIDQVIANENKVPKAEKYTTRTTFQLEKIKTDQKMNFYTGLSTISTFSVLFSLFHLNLSNMQYWRGTSRHVLKSNRKRKFTRSSRKILWYKEEFLLTLMKLRLGLLNEDLADRFGISPAICSSTFTIWIRLLKILLVMHL